MLVSFLMPDLEYLKFEKYQTRSQISKKKKVGFVEDRRCQDVRALAQATSK